VFFDPFEEYVIVPEETRQKWVFPLVFLQNVTWTPSHRWYLGMFRGGKNSWQKASTWLISVFMALL
jgi:hypothetical protein